MNSFLLMAQLSESDKRVLVALLLLVFLVFVLIGFIGSIIKRVMISQGKRIDNKLYDVLDARVITEKKHFVKYARKKNWIMFFKETYIPIIILIISTLLLIFRNTFGKGGFSYNVFDYKETGFSTLLFIWDFKDPNCYVNLFNTKLKILVNWPPLINTPHFELQAWASYLFVPAVFVGGLWYLFCVQAFIARGMRIYKLSTSVFEKSLDQFNINNVFNNPNSNIK